MTIFRYDNALTRVEERLRIMIKDASKYHYRSLPNIPREQSPVQTITVPSYETWIVTMWHLGRDSRTEYSGERFSFSTIDALDVLIRVYTKEMDDGRIQIRLEKQEYLNKILTGAISERLSVVVEEEEEEEV
ncbi:MAG: hypothetical protein R2685_06105 [Candidatus Nitrosocosmicus sp.]|nr:hypothetical protein [Candidatus Nitrosocosmicus sp.]